MDYSKYLPNADSVYHYVANGRPVGHFLTAVICNDLFEAFSRADDYNLANMRYYVMFFYNNAPAGCFGSEEKMKNWIENGGMKGIMTYEPSFEELMTGKIA